MKYYQQGYKDGLEGYPFRKAFEFSEDYKLGYTNGSMTKQALENYNENYKNM